MRVASFFATQEVRTQLQGTFPDCLNQAPLLIPAEGTALGNKLRQWLLEKNLHPQIVGEFDDSALMRAFGQGGIGAFIAPFALEETLIREAGKEILGRADSITEQFSAISIERKITHPAAIAITKHAQDWLKTYVTNA